MSLKSFTDYLLLEKNYSALTVNAYNKDLEKFSDFIKEEYETPSINRVNYSQIRSWIVSLVEKGDIELNPLAKHKALKISKKVQVPFSETEIAMVLDDLHFDNDFEGVRDKLIIELFYSTGIRRIHSVIRNSIANITKVFKSKE